MTCLRGWQARHPPGRTCPRVRDKAADSYCHELLARLNPGRQIVQINIDPVAVGGGGIHCITLHQPA
nr:agmatine deiminase family protein [Aeromonas salmonicida]